MHILSGKLFTADSVINELLLYIPQISHCIVAEAYTINVYTTTTIKPEESMNFFFKCTYLTTIRRIDARRDAMNTQKINLFQIKLFYRAGALPPFIYAHIIYSQCIHLFVYRIFFYFELAFSFIAVVVVAVKAAVIHRT